MGPAEKLNSSTNLADFLWGARLLYFVLSPADGLNALFDYTPALLNEEKEKGFGEKEKK